MVHTTYNNNNNYYFLWTHLSKTQLFSSLLPSFNGDIDPVVSHIRTNSCWKQEPLHCSPFWSGKIHIIFYFCFILLSKDIVPSYYVRLPKKKFCFFSILFACRRRRGWLKKWVGAMNIGTFNQMRKKVFFDHCIWSFTPNPKAKTVATIIYL